MGLPFYIVDVFAEQKYAGNQLAVFRFANSLTTSQMQRIAKEVNYSETTFILSDITEKGGYAVRIFTPAQELPFAGHPTLGTAFVLQHEVIQKSVLSLILNLQIGQVPVMFQYIDQKVDVLWMNQPSPVFGQQLESSTVAAILSLEPDQVDDRFAIEEVSTGLPFIIVPLKTQAAIKQAKINRDRLFALIETTQAKAILVFCPEPEDSRNQLKVRMFGDALGVPEDPATGSANGCLAAYLVQHEYFGTSDINIRVEQGAEIGRPSLLLLKAQKTDEEIRVSIGGRVILVAKGEFV